MTQNDGQNTHGIFQATPKPLHQKHGISSYIFGGNGLPGFVVPLLLLVVLGGVVWYAYPKTAEDGIVPVIQADPSAYKVKPENPGGMNVPHQDSTVYEPFENTPAGRAERLVGSGENPAIPSRKPNFEPMLNLDWESGETGQQVETLIAREETVPLSQLKHKLQNPDRLQDMSGKTTAVETPAAQQSDVADEEKMSALVERLTAAPVEDVEEVTSAPVKPPAPPAEVVQLEDVPAVVPTRGTEIEIETLKKDLEPVKQALEAAAKKEVKTAPVATGAWMLQLGAFSTGSSAEKAWDSFGKKYGSVLDGLSPDYQQAEVKGKTLYRLRAGGFESRADALARCEDLKKQGGSCLVVK
ncbi:MAG: SPOR domain-containing protein [Pseudomonadota bacterium]|nr:SPOR domain-containing protein [Pseudomonadota bacterium]QKK04896.1 MAG: SPOR domain-containing protein [Pseudomonadota bacterium]